MGKKDWVEEVESRAKSADNVCAVIELIYNSLSTSVDEDIKALEFAEIPVDLEFKRDLKKKFEKLAKMCDKYGEYKEAEASPKSSDWWDKFWEEQEAMREPISPEERSDWWDKFWEEQEAMRQYKKQKVK